MNNAGQFAAEIPDGLEPLLKRRKVRKGTQSCWECKRRKTRCAFSAELPEICEGCRRRGTDCVSQEETDKPPPPRSNRHLADRLGRVEALVAQLLKLSRKNNGDPTSEFTDSAIKNQGQKHHRSRSKSPSISTPRCSVLNVDSSQVMHTQSPAAALTAVSPCDVSPRPSERKSQRLLDVWPSQGDFDIILRVPVETSEVVYTALRGVFQDASLPSSKDWLYMPPATSPPVLAARALLILATFLQGIPSSFTHHLQNLTVSHGEIIRHAVKAAHDEVTTDDDQIATLEGIECIMLESHYENYKGNLHRAWALTRRGVMIAQMLGLDQGALPPSVVGAFIDAEAMWFRLVQFDKYLSLMLGLPQSSLKDCYASPETLSTCTPLERMHRLCCAAGGRVMQRDFSTIYDTKTTEEIDKLLGDSSNALPDQWWIMPSTISCTSQEEKLRATLRLSDQLMYFHILLQLHFPFLLLPRSSQEYNYNRMAAVTTSREILSRFISFRGSASIGYHCRGIDLIVFIAGTALCLAHIGDQGLCKKYHFLGHQHRSDRGMLEQSLALLQELEPYEDPVAITVATLLRRLLSIGADIASGGKYTAKFSTEPRNGANLGFHVVDGDNTVLQIHLPYLNIIEIQRHYEISQDNAIEMESPWADLDGHYGTFWHHDDFACSADMGSQLIPTSIQNSY